MNTWVTSGTLDVKGVDKEAVCLILLRTLWSLFLPDAVLWDDHLVRTQCWSWRCCRILIYLSKMASGEKSTALFVVLWYTEKIAICSSQITGRIDSSGRLCGAAPALFAFFSFCSVFFWNHSFVNLRSVCCTSTIVLMHSEHQHFQSSCGSMILLCLFVFIIYFSKNKGTENSLFFPFSVLKGSSSWLRMPRLCSWSFSWGGQKANTQIRE